VVGGGGLHRGPAGVDRGVQVRLLPGLREPDLQGQTEVGQHRGAVGVVGGDGVHRGPAGVDRGVQVSPPPDPLEPDA
jgi:hypothetical protein